MSTECLTTAYWETWGFKAVLWQMAVLPLTPPLALAYTQSHLVNTCFSPSPLQFFFLFWFVLFFLRPVGVFKSFSLHSLSLNSFRTMLSHHSLLCNRIQNPCVVRGGINTGMLLTHSRKKKKKKRMSWRTLWYKSWKRIAVKGHNCSSLTAVLQSSKGKRRLVYSAVTCTGLRVNRNWNINFIIHLNSSGGVLTVAG